ncbi:hypothetical protein H072_10084 [Dactylellina haptotyla CBS 200.50]|uniref:Uncharacterized protein n=1 Tax=Dactylellina haptotyla (strain CBS 200.50) TaxID=1284197 RepID=S8A117_DACHA|nr:hypothetical protein H072_10084 [Dactylellina haptotyla CBS 200.50]
MHIPANYEKLVIFTCNVSNIISASLVFPKMLRSLIFLSVSTLVIAPPPNGWNRPRTGTESSPFRTHGPTITPPTPLIDNADISGSQYSPSGGSRDDDLTLGTISQYQSGVSPLNGTPRSARRQEVRFLTKKQRKEGVSPAPAKVKNIKWDDWEDPSIADIPSGGEKSMMPFNNRFLGPKLPTGRPLSPKFRPTFQISSPSAGEDVDVEDDFESWDESQFLELDVTPATDQLRRLGPGLTPRVEQFMTSRGRQNGYVLPET